MPLASRVVFERLCDLFGDAAGSRASARKRVLPAPSFSDATASWAGAAMPPASIDALCRVCARSRRSLQNSFRQVRHDACALPAKRRLNAVPGD